MLPAQPRGRASWPREWTHSRPLGPPLLPWGPSLLPRPRAHITEAPLDLGRLQKASEQKAGKRAGLLEWPC